MEVTSNQKTALIETKFSAPRPSHKISLPCGLLPLLQQGKNRSLTLVKAAAGFGKTTILSAWKNKIVAENQKAAWLTLDQDDNDSLRFANYLIASLSEVLSEQIDELISLTNLGQISSTRMVLTSLINCINRNSEEITLFIDDYDKINNSQVHELTEFLLQHLPDNLHMVIACRAAPPIALSNLRAKDRLVEITTDEMRFNFDDTKRFFSESTNLELNIGEIRFLQDATEGWIAGLQMASIILSRRDKGNVIISDDFKRLFSGKSRFLSSYISENVMHLIPDEMKRFMLCTSILERLNGDLCNYVAETNDAEHKLEWIERENVFFQSIDDNNHWYRYHGLFTEFLQEQLNKHMADAIPALHMRAAEWFAAHDQWAEAVRHSIAGGRIDLATQWVQRCAMREVQDSRVQSFLSWVNKLPSEAVRHKPALYLAKAWALLLTIRVSDAEYIVNDITQLSQSNTIHLSADMQSELYDVRLAILAIKDDPIEAKKLSKICLERFINRQPPKRGESWVDSSTLNVLVFSHLKTGDTKKAREITNLVHKNIDRRVNLFTSSYSSVINSNIDLWEGDYCAAKNILKPALENAETIAGRRSVAASLVAAYIAQIYYEWNDLDAVEDLLADRMDIINEACYVDSVIAAYTSLARVYVQKNNFPLAHELLDHAEDIAQRHSWLRLFAACAVNRCRIYILQNKLVDARRAADKYAVIEKALHKQQANSETRHYSNLLKAYITIESEDYYAAESLLSSMLTEAKLLNKHYVCIHMMLLLTYVEEKINHRDKAMTYLQQAVDNAVPSDLIRLLADESRYIGNIITNEEFIRKNIRHKDYLDTVIKVCKDNSYSHINTSDGQLTSIDENELYGTLTSREKDILELVVQGLSNKEIARSLCVTAETIKWHLKNIYGKMGVNGRSAAAYHVLSRRESSALTQP